MSNRRKARELALQFLYGIDMNREGFSEQALRLFWAGNETPGDVKSFAQRLILGAAGQMETIDGIIRSYAESWSLERLASVDRNVLRIAVYEILKEDDIPLSVTINEAIEVVKLYGTEESGPFVNGLLDRIGKALGKDKAVPHKIT